MKKIFCLLIITSILCSGIANAFASPMGEFQSLMYALQGGLGDQIKPVLREDFFLTSNVSHINCFRKTKNLDCSAIMNNQDDLAQLAAIMACEMRFVKANYGDDFAAKFFGEKKMIIDLTKPVYIGLDGNVFSIYLTCEDVGCFILYGPLINRLHFTTVSQENADEVEELLFKRCSNGYAQVDHSILISEYLHYESEFQKNTELQNLLF